MRLGNKGFFTVKKSFVFLFCVVIALGYLSEFVLFFSLICLHEAAHILTAKYLGAKITNVTVMPLGLSAGIKNFDFLSVPKKVAILMSGPLLNLFLAGTAFVSFGEKYLFFIDANLCIFVINVLPVMPLDGGNAFMAVFNNKIGIMPTADILTTIGRIISVVVMITGIVQIILYPYNMSLLCLGFYLFMIAKDKGGIYQNNFIKVLSFAEAKENLIFMPLKQLAIMRDCPMRDAVRHFGFNCYTVINIISEGRILSTLTERQILEHILKNGIDGTVFDVFSSLVESNIEILL